jgi:polysaccharide pyruvyl transferase WcaK-like protein
MPTARVALWGTFDVDNYGDHLFPRVAASELDRRLPGVVVDAYSPYGWLHPTALDDHHPASPLGPWSPWRARQLAAAHHLVLVGGGELIHLDDRGLAVVYDTSVDELDRMAPSRYFVEGLGPEPEADCPVVWHGVGVPWTPGEAEARRLRAALADRPYVTVRDRHSAQRLAAAGIDRAVEVVPDSGLLLDRIMPAPVLRARLDRLRAAGHYPRPDVPVLAIQGCELLVPGVERVAAAVKGWWADRPDGEVALVETGRCRGDRRFADALERVLTPQRVWRLPADAAVEDVAAAVAGADAFAGSSLHGAITAFVFGRPFVVLNLIDDAKLDGFGDLVGLDRRIVHAGDDIGTALDEAVALPPEPALLPRLQARIDRHFDRVAELVAERARLRPDVVADGSLDHYAVADHLGRLRHELAAVRAGLVRAEAELDVARAGLARAETELAATDRRAGEAEQELTALLATRTFRLLAPARSLYGRLRRPRPDRSG